MTANCPSSGAFLQCCGGRFAHLTAKPGFKADDASVNENLKERADQEHRHESSWTGGENNAEDREQLVLENLPRTVRSDGRYPRCAKESIVQEARGAHRNCE